MYRSDVLLPDRGLKSRCMACYVLLPAMLPASIHEEQNAQLTCNGSKPLGEWKLCYHKQQRHRGLLTSFQNRLLLSTSFKGQQSSLKNKSNLPETFWISVLKFGRTDVVPALALAFLLTSSCVTSPSAQPLLNARETVSFLHCPQKARDGLVPGPCVVSILFYLLKRFQHFSSRLLLTFEFSLYYPT